MEPNPSDGECLMDMSVADELAGEQLKQEASRATMTRRGVKRASSLEAPPASRWRPHLRGGARHAYVESVSSSQSPIEILSERRIQILGSTPEILESSSSESSPSSTGQRQILESSSSESPPPSTGRRQRRITEGSSNSKPQSYRQFGSRGLLAGESSRRRRNPRSATVSSADEQQTHQEPAQETTDTEAQNPTTPDTKKRRYGPGTGPSWLKKRTSPKKSETMIIPGSELPNGGRYALPKGTMMEMLQTRDLEVNRLMEELQDYEDEAMVLSHQIYVATSENYELRMQVQEMSASMANIQHTASLVKLTNEVGPKLTYWDDYKFESIWNCLFKNVLAFADLHCKWSTESGYDLDGMARYRPNLQKARDGTTGHWGTFKAFMAEDSNEALKKIQKAQFYVRQITSDRQGRRYPARLDAFIGDGKANELIPTAIIMKILQTEIFDKIRWLLRSEPFWDPMQNPSLPGSRGAADRPVNLRVDSSEDFLVKQEHTSAQDDQTAYEYNCLRAKMMLHLMREQDLGTAVVNYLNRVGVLILNAIYPFITLDCINHDKIGVDEADAGTPLLRFEEILKDTRHAREKESQGKLQIILTQAMNLALLMRSDNTVAFLDGGGWNGPWNGELMQNVAPVTSVYKQADKDEQARYDDTTHTFAWLVVAPCLKRTGVLDGTGYNQYRVLSKTRVALRSGDKDNLIEGTDKWVY